MGVYLLGVIGIVSITGFFLNNLATFDNSSTSNSASAHTKSKQSGQKAQGFGQRVPTYATNTANSTPGSYTQAHTER